MTVLWSRKSEANLISILTYVAKDNPIAARQLIDEIIGSVELTLAEYPLAGRQGRIDGTREWVAHKHYIVVYKTLDTQITILTVRHTSPRWPKNI